MSFLDRFKGAPDPMEAASPPPFKASDRVIVSPRAMDGMFLGGCHGAVLGVEFTTDPEDVYGPWVIRVLLDGQRDVLKFHAAELTRETEPPTPAEPPVITVTQPEDNEPYTPTGEVPASNVGHWIQCAKELRHETVAIDSPVYDDVTAEAMARDGLAAEVSAYLAEAAGGAR